MNEEFAPQQGNFAIIPATILYDTELRPNEKLLFAEITSLTMRYDYCFASNEWFSKNHNVDKRTISRWLSHLSKLGYIKIVIEYKKGTKEVNRRYLIPLLDLYGNNKFSNNDNDKKVTTPPDKKVTTPLTKKSPPHDQNVVDNNKRINNKRINNNPLNPPKGDLKVEKEFLHMVDKSVRELFRDFLKLRKELKAKNTDRALNILINKLNKHSVKDQISMLERSIENSWKGLFDLTNTKKVKSSKKEDIIDCGTKYEESSYDQNMALINSFRKQG
jgi:hypothetical protein